MLMLLLVRARPLCPSMLAGVYATEWLVSRTNRHWLTLAALSRLTRSADHCGSRVSWRTGTLQVDEYAHVVATYDAEADEAKIY